MLTHYWQTAGYNAMDYLLGNRTTSVHRDVPHVKYACGEPSDPCVDDALKPDIAWMAMLSYTPYLKRSPAAPFLSSYYPDGVGMSAVDTSKRILSCWMFYLMLMWWRSFPLSCVSYFCVACPGFKPGLQKFSWCDMLCLSILTVQ